MWWWRPVKRGPLLGLGLGLWAGGGEALALAATAPVSLDLGSGLLWGILAVTSGGLVGLWAGLAGGAFADVVVRGPPLPTRHAVSMGAAGLLLAGWHLWPMAWLKLGQGLPIPAAALAVTPIGVAGVVYFNAHYWLRREELGELRRVGWLAGSVGAGLVLGLAGGAWLSLQDHGGRQALDVDPHVLLVTVEGLSPDDLASFSDTASAQTPQIDALAAQGVRFHEAISPMPETGPAHVALLTARHPARLGVWSDEHVLGRGSDTLQDRLRREGYATGAFVSTLAVGAHLGLDRGFGVYDDDRLATFWPAGTAALSLVRHSTRLWMQLAPQLDRWPRLYRRPDAETVERATAWMARHADVPQLAWVHLAGLEAPDGPAREARLRALDAHVGALVDALGHGPDARPRMVVLMGVGAGDPAVDGVAERRVRVPLVIVPRKMRVYTPDVRLAVRTMDVPATILDQLALEPFPKVDGADLSGFAENTKSRGYASLLAARVQGGASGPEVELGYRAGRAGTTAMIKLITRPATGEAHLYDLGDDPGEQTDLAESQPEAVAELSGHTRGEAGEAGAGVLPPPTVPESLVRVLRWHRFGGGSLRTRGPVR